MSKSLKSALANLEQLHSQPFPNQIKTIVAETLSQLHVVEAEIAKGEEQSRLAALYQVGQLLGSSLDLEEVLNQVMDAAIRLTKAERGFLILAKPGDPALDVRISRNISKTDLDGPEYKFSDTVIQTALTSGKGVVTTNAQEDPRFAERESVVSFSLRSVLCVPLKVRGEVEGVIYVDNRAQSGLFTNDDLDLLNAFASQAASAIANAQQYTQTDEVLAARVQELEELVRFSRIINTRSSLADIFEDTQKWAAAGTAASQSWVAAFDETLEDRSELTVMAGANRGSQIPVTAPLLAATLESNTPHIYEPAADAPARVVVPLLDERKTLGVVVAESQHAFSTEDLNFLTRLANLTMTAVGKMHLLESIQEAKNEKAQFVSTVSHELRLPMTSIMGYTDLLKQGAMGEVNEAQMGFLKVIRENSDRMAKLIADLSDIYKAEGGRLHLDVAPTSLLFAVQNAAEQIEPTITERSQRLDVLVSNELPAVQADPKRVNQMVQYLLENAALYSPPGTALEVRARLEDGVARLMVADQGTGISPEDQAQIFDQFFRSEAEEVREHKGWGLGLCVVKSLSELMGGQTGFESDLGKGSTFWFTLPLVKE